MKYETQLDILDRAYEIALHGERDTAKRNSLPVIEEMNREIFNATRNSKLPAVGYKRHYLTFSEYLMVLRAQGFAGTSLDSVTAISWNKVFNDDDSYTFVGSLVRHGKRYGQYDYREDPRAMRSLAFLASIIAFKLSQPRDQRLVVSVPSSSHSTNILPRQIAELVAAINSRYHLAHFGSLVRCRDIGPMKDIHNIDEKMRIVRGSMKSDPELVSGRQILLIDDLLGSGGTLRESARALKAAGASEVHALAMVKTRSFAKETMCKT